MKPFIKDNIHRMGGTKDAFYNFNCPSRYKKQWARLKVETRRKKRRSDKINLNNPNE